MSTAQLQLLPTTCTRCGAQGKASGGTKQARLLRRAQPGQRGLCASCAMTCFIKSTPSLMVGIEANGVEMLLSSMVQEAFAQLLRIAQSDADPVEVDWQRVVENWDLECGDE